MIRPTGLLAVLSLGLFCWAGNLRAAEDVKVECIGDTFLQEGITGKPGGRGTMPEFKLMLKPPGGENYHTLLMFNKDKFVNVRFRSARLRIQVLNMALNGSPGKVEVHKVTKGWDEKTASQDCSNGAGKWDKSMGDFDPKIYGVADLTLLPQVNAAVLVMDITELVKEWQASPATNFGLLLKLSPGSTADLRINSREAEDKTGNSFPTIFLTDKPILQPGDVDLTFETSMLAAAKTGTPFEQTIKARGGKPPYAFLVQGMLPKGITLDKDGKISGTPEREGKFNIKVKLVDSEKTEVVQPYAWEVTKGEVKPEGPKPPVKTPDKPVEKPLDPALPQDDG